MKKMLDCIKTFLGRKFMKKPTAQEAIDYLNSKWKNQTCPMCGSRTWNVTDKVFELREFNDGNLVLGGPGGSVYPVIPVTCGNCGNTIFVSALSTGLIKE